MMKSALNQRHMTFMMDSYLWFNYDKGMDTVIIHSAY